MRNILSSERKIGNTYSAGGLKHKIIISDNNNNCNCHKNKNCFKSLIYVNSLNPYSNPVKLVILCFVNINDETLAQRDY